MSNIAPYFRYFSSQSRKLNMKISILFLLFFLLSFFFIKHNSKSLRHIQTILTPNECSTITDLPFLSAAYELRLTSYGPKHVSQWLSCIVDYNSRPSAIFRPKLRNGHSLFSTSGQNSRQTSVRCVY